MRFGRYLEEAQSRSGILRHLDYKMLKDEIKRTAETAELGMISSSSAALRFGKQLEAELTEVGSSWEMWAWRLRDMAEKFYSTSDTLLREDAAHSALIDIELPLKLLEPLQEFLPVAALADSLRRHRLLQMTAVVKIQKKFSKIVGVQPLPGFKSSELLERSALASSLIHDLCTRLEETGDTFLRLGLGSVKADVEDNTCSICISDLTDPVRLPCSHRFCVHCVLPLFDRFSGDGLDAVLLHCPLCRMAGPDVPQALCLDGLLARFGRGMHYNVGVPIGNDVPDFTAVIVSSLAKLAAPTAYADEEQGHASIPCHKSGVFGKQPTDKHIQDSCDANRVEMCVSIGCTSAERFTTGESKSLARSAIQSQIIEPVIKDIGGSREAGSTFSRLSPLDVILELESDCDECSVLRHERDEEEELKINDTTETRTFFFEEECCESGGDSLYTGDGANLKLSDLFFDFSQL